jgi:DNA-binding LytR/AlgR family response regulator
MEVLVIEHENLLAQKLKELLFEVDESIKIVGVTNNINGAAEWLTRNRIPDIILASEESMAGIEEKRKKDIRAVVTFTTMSDNYRFVAFRYKTIREILEELPVTEERIVTNASAAMTIHKPIHHHGFKERFLVKHGQRLLSIAVDQVAYFFSEERFIFLRTMDGQKFLLEYRMEQLEKMLSPITFFRINRSFVISLQSVKEIHSYFGNRLKLFLTPTADKDVIVSRKRVGEFKGWLDR